MSAIVPFDFEGNAVRVIMREGVPWWVLADVCRVLDIVNPTRAADRLDDDEKGLHTVKTLGGDQEMVVINESGLFALILTSRKPEAKRFKKWVTAVVLPSIARTGSYGPDLGAMINAAVQQAMVGFEATIEAMVERRVGERLLTDERKALFNYISPLRAIIDFGGVRDSRQRRPLSNMVRVRLQSWCEHHPESGHPKPIERPDGSAGVSWLFPIDAARAWFTSAEWRNLYAVHLDKLARKAGQSVLDFKVVKGGKPDHGTDSVADA
jgi:prophage antirepressor-like protein